MVIVIGPEIVDTVFLVANNRTHGYRTEPVTTPTVIVIVTSLILMTIVEAILLTRRHYDT